MDPSGRFGVLPILALIALTGLLASCSVGDPNKPMSGRFSGNYYETQEDAIYAALKKTYAFAKLNKQNREYGFLVYAERRYVDEDIMYYYISDRIDGGDSLVTGDQSILMYPDEKLQRKIDQGTAVLIAAIHSHPRGPNEGTQVFSQADAIYVLPNDEQHKASRGIPFYVVLPNGEAYFLTPDRRDQDDYEKYKRIVEYDESLAHIVK